MQGLTLLPQNRQIKTNGADAVICEGVETKHKAPSLRKHARKRSHTQATESRLLRSHMHIFSLADAMKAVVRVI